VPEPVRVKGLTEAEWNTWKHHPVTKVFRQFLADFRASLHGTLLQEWESGSLIGKEARELEMRGRCLVLSELTDPQFAALVQFYAVPTQEGDHAATTDQDHPQ